jgi:hypothetical protein
MLIAVTGLLTLNPSMLTNAHAQMYGFNYGNDHNKVYPDQKKGSDVNVQKIKCLNSNINVNGIDITQIPQDGATTATSGLQQANEQDPNGANGNGIGDRINFEKNLVNICVNVNENAQTKIEEPQTALTVKKEIFGCNNIRPAEMNCEALQNNDPGWLLCTDPVISNSEFCQAISANLFDIEVLDDQNSQIEQFEGSAQGTTIQNLQPGTYTVNEIKHTSSEGQLGTENDVTQACTAAGFTDGGLLITPGTEGDILYTICFEYEDEQGNDCSAVTLAEGEAKTCIVKNYLRIAD